MTVTGIRPDFIRMSSIFKRLDWKTEHTLVHTGQHYDRLLSDVFFEDLQIREPDYNLGIGGEGKTHVEQQAEVSVRLTKLLQSMKDKPDIVLFLGDSNSVTAAVPLKKEGYTIGHIEAGMRSGDKRMLEEINRTVCDHCSDFHFVYHENYKQNLLKENLPEDGIYVVGNTIVEAAKPIVGRLKQCRSFRNQILLDIHRPENFQYGGRLKKILTFANRMAKDYKLPVKMLRFRRTMEYMWMFGIKIPKRVEVVDLMSYQQFMKEQYNSFFIISDSGTAQEEPALLDVPVIVPRDFTERPESVKYGNSMMLNVNKHKEIDWDGAKLFVENFVYSTGHMRTDWLGRGKTSELVVNALVDRL